MREMNKPYKTIQILLRKTIDKTKNLFQKTLQNLIMSFLFGGYRKLPKPHPTNPLFSSRSNSKMQELDNFYTGLSEQWEESDHDQMIKRKKKSALSAKQPICVEENNAKQSVVEKFLVENTQEESKKEEKNKGDYHEEKRRGPCSQIANVLTQKMKDLARIEVDDHVDHVLDIEEVLHYYYRLTCPVYVDIVDNFFTDIYSEFFIPQSSHSVDSSTRRRCPVNL